MWHAQAGGHGRHGCNTCVAARMNAILWLCELGVHATYCTSSVLQVNLQARKCEEGNCQTVAAFGYPGGPSVRCGMHRLTGMVCMAASLCCSTLTDRTVQTCGACFTLQQLCVPGQPALAEVRSKRLPERCIVWLPRRPQRAVWHAPAHWHGVHGCISVLQHPHRP